MQRQHYKKKKKSIIFQKPVDLTVAEGFLKCQKLEDTFI